MGYWLWARGEAVYSVNKEGYPLGISFFHFEPPRGLSSKVACEIETHSASLARRTFSSPHKIALQFCGDPNALTVLVRVLGSVKNKKRA